MKVWITKYALTEGILYGITEEKPHVGMLIELKKEGHWERFAYPYFHKGEWFDSEEKAVSHANEMVARKIKRLEKSLSKFRNMKFEVKGDA